VPEVVTPETPAAPQARRYEIPVLAEQTVETLAPAAAESVPNAQNTEAEAASDKPVVETPEKEEVTPEQAAKREKEREGRRFGRKLDTAYRQRAEAQAKADLLEKRLAELEKPQAPKAPEGEPRLEQFDYDPEKYATAKAEFAKTQAAKDFETKQRTESQQKAHQKLVSDWETKAERGADKYDDWQDKVGELKPTAPFVAALMEADNAEDIAHYLGSNPKEAHRIASLSPMSQVREIGKLEAKLLSTPEKPKTPSKAPAPITPLTGTATIATDQPSDTDDYATWFKKRNKQAHGR
jgi:hypothetical protein